MKPVFFILTVAVACSFYRCSTDNADLETIVLNCSDITTNTTLTRAEYIVNCDINVKNGAILTIEPGSVFKFSSDGALSTSYGGSIKAIGTEKKPIIFTGQEAIKGYWKGITIATNSLNNIFTYCHFEYGGKGVSPNGMATVRLGRFNYSDDVGRAVFMHCEFSHGGASGLFVNTWSVIDGSDHNIFTENDGFPVSISFEAVSGIGVNNSYSLNGKNAVYVESYDYNVNQDITFYKIAVPYYLNHTGGSPLKRFFAKCTVKPGTELKMGANMLFAITNGIPGTGSFYCAGTTSEHIKISGWEPGKGFWDRIQFEGSVSFDNRFEYVDISDGGGHQENSWDDQGIITIKDIYDADSRLTILNSSFSNSLHHGIHLFECSASGSTVVNGTTGAVNIKNTLLDPASGNTFSNIDGINVVTVD